MRKYWRCDEITLSIFKQNTGGQELIDISEGYNIWSLLTLRYYMLENYHFLRNFIHDKDLAIVINKLVDIYQDQVWIMEEESKRFALKMPERSSAEIKTTQRINEIKDSYIYQTSFHLTKYDLFMLGHAIRTSLTNDLLRKEFIKFTSKLIKSHDMLQKYGKLKGYQDPVPAYKTAKSVSREQLSVAEAYHIWDMINHRYEQLSQTMFYLEICHDADFGLLLKNGQETLENEISQLERVSNENEVPLPKRPPAGVAAKIDRESLTDRFIYRNILQGMQEAIDMQIRAVINGPKNDSIEKLFIRLYSDEIKTHDLYIKYGKAKGWLNIPPMMEMI